MYATNTNNQPSAPNANANAGSTPTHSPLATPISDPAWLRQQIRDRAIPVPTNATPAEVIPWVRKSIARHNQIGQLIPINVDSRPAWQALMDDWQDFLQKLETLQNLAKNPSAAPTQPLTNLPKSCQNLPKVANTLPDPAKNLPDPASTLPNPANPKPIASPSIKSIKSIPSIPDKPTPPSTDLEPKKDELELADLTDGFATEKERLAAARSELQAHLTNQPVRFARLSPQQQAAVFALLETGYSTRAIAKLLAEPPPIGAAIKVSKTAVGDWRKQYKLHLINEASRRRAEAQLQSALETLDKTPNPDAAFQQAAERILKLRILTSEDAPLDTLDQLVATLTKLRKQALAERKQLHTEKSK